MKTAMSVLMLALFLVVSCKPETSSTASSAPERKAFTIGAILPLTGNIADQGASVKNGLDIAKDDLAREGIFFNLVYDDSKGANSKEAVAAYQKMREEQNLVAVLTMGSGVGVALTEPMNQDAIVQMGVATATPAYATKDDFTYRNFPSAVSEGVENSRIAFDVLKRRRVAFVYTNNDYGVGERDIFVPDFTKRGGEVVAMESLDPSQQDFHAQVLKVKSASPDIVVLAVYQQEGTLFLRQASEQGIDVPILASTAILGSALYTNPEATKNLLISVQRFDSKNDVARTFVTKYKSRYGVEPDAYAARAYEALLLLAQQTALCDAPTGECLRDTLNTMEPYLGVTGEIDFYDYGDRKSYEFELRKVQGNATVHYEG